MGLAELWSETNKLVMHKLAPMVRREADGSFVALEFEERLAVIFARSLCEHFHGVLARASIIAIEQQMESQSTVVMATALWSVISVLYPTAVVVKVTPQAWRAFFSVNVHGYPQFKDDDEKHDYANRKRMSGLFLREYIPLAAWEECVREFDIREVNRNGNSCPDNYDGIEAAIIACYALRNYDELRLQPVKPAAPKSVQVRNLRPFISVQTHVTIPARRHVRPALEERGTRQTPERRALDRRASKKGGRGKVFGKRKRVKR